MGGYVNGLEKVNNLFRNLNIPTCSMKTVYYVIIKAHRSLKYEILS